MANTSPVGAQHHIVPVRTYALTLFALLFLMALTIGISFVPLGHIGNNIAAMAIACIKASLVFSIFMGVAWGTKLLKFWALLGFVWMLLIFGILIDYATRTTEVVPGFYHDAGSALPVGGAKSAPQLDEGRTAE